MIVIKQNTISNKKNTSLKIKGVKGLYKIGDVKIKNSGDIYLLDNIYYTSDDPGLFFCNVDNIYKSTRKNKKVLGVVDIVNDTLILDTFDGKYLSNFPLYYKDKKEYLITYLVDLSKNKKYRKNIHNGSYYHIKGNFAISSVRNTNFIKDYKQRLEYNASREQLMIVSDIMNSYNLSQSTLDKYNFNSLPSFINNFTFGLEFETTTGIFDNYHLNKLGIIPLRDGSISGIEYVTVPLKGINGFYRLYEIVEFLKNNTQQDYTCSLHLHIGGVPRTESFVLAFYKILCLIQEQYFDLFPIYKKYNLGIKNKNYSAPLPIVKLLSELDHTIDSNNIYKNFSIIYKLLTNIPDFEGTINDIDYHPNNKQNNHKWQMDARYYFINLIPLIFGNKKTVEFRIHEESYNFENIVMFILFNMYIVQFIISKENDILKNIKKYINIDDILSFIVGNVNDNKSNNIEIDLFNYISRRSSIRQELFYKGQISKSVDMLLKMNDFPFIKKQNVPTKIVMDTDKGYTYVDNNVFQTYNNTVTSTEKIQKQINKLKNFDPF